jgi:hypothetical protein
MPGLFTDEMLGAFAVQADPGGVGDALKERYEGLMDRVALCEPLVGGLTGRLLAQGYTGSASGRVGCPTASKRS